jgi:hypothetical protein
MTKEHRFQTPKYAKYSTPKGRVRLAYPTATTRATVVNGKTMQHIQEFGGNRLSDDCPSMAAAWRNAEERLEKRYEAERAEKRAATQPEAK